MTPAERARVLARVRDERVAAGLTPTITNEAVLRLIAAVFVGGAHAPST